MSRGVGRDNGNQWGGIRPDSSTLILLQNDDLIMMMIKMMIKMIKMMR